jgi:hypothetical protein
VLSEPVIIEDDKRVLSYRNKACSDLLAGFSGPGRVPISAIGKAMDDALATNPVFFNVVQEIDLSCNNLIDSDAEVVLAIVRKLVGKCEHVTVRLSDNRFYGYTAEFRVRVDPALFAILELPMVDKVILLGNPITGINRFDFFIEAFRRNVLSKLVFLENHHLATTHTVSMYLKHATLSMKDAAQFYAMVLKAHGVIPE